jgi:hypothetical protein
MTIKFTKRQQQKIDSCKDEKIKQLWIDQFTHIQELKQLPQVKEFMKQERKKERELTK